MYQCRKHKPTTKQETIQPFGSGSDPSPIESDPPIALQKGKYVYTDHLIDRFVSYDVASPSYHSFPTSLDNIKIPNHLQHGIEQGLDPSIHSSFHRANLGELVFTPSAGGNISSTEVGKSKYLSLPSLLSDWLQDLFLFLLTVVFLICCTFFNVWLDMSPPLSDRAQTWRPPSLIAPLS